MIYSCRWPKEDLLSTETEQKENRSGLGEAEGRNSKETCSVQAKTCKKITTKKIVKQKNTHTKSQMSFPQFKDIWAVLPVHVTFHEARSISCLSTMPSYTLQTLSNDSSKIYLYLQQFKPTAAANSVKQRLKLLLPLHLSYTSKPSLFQPRQKISRTQFDINNYVS